MQVKEVCLRTLEPITPSLPGGFPQQVWDSEANGANPEVDHRARIQVQVEREWESERGKGRQPVTGVSYYYKQL